MSYEAIYRTNLYYDKLEQVYFCSIFRLQEYTPYRSSSWTNKELSKGKKKFQARSQANRIQGIYNDYDN